MDRNKINISKVETFFNGLLLNNVSANVFPSQAPDSIEQSWKEFIVYDCAGIMDMDAYGRGTVLLYIYVPPMGASDKKNVAHFSNIEQKLDAAINNNKDATYHIERRGTYTDYDEQKKMFVNIIEINLVILT